MSKNRDPHLKRPSAEKRQAAALDALIHPKTPRFVGPHETAQDAANAAAAEHFGLPYVKEEPGGAVAQLEPMPDAHDTLAQAVAELLDVLTAVGRANVRAQGKAPKKQADAERHEAVKTALRRVGRGDLLQKPYRERAIAKVFAAFAEFRRIEGMPTPQAFVRRLRGR